MAKILILRGLPASGKTTYAREWIEEDSEHRVRFNRDDIRNMLGQYWVPNRESLITDIFYEFLNSSMISGYDIIIDNMNLNEKYIKEIEDYVNEFNQWISYSPSNIRYELEIKDFFNVPLETCIERDSNRKNPVGEKVIRSIYNKYKNTIIPWKYLS